MRRKQYKIKWEPTYDVYDNRIGEGKVDCDSLITAQYPDPDFVHKDIRYWFGTMRSAGKDSKYLYLMDECPRTGAIMSFNSALLTWYIQPIEVQKAYNQWLLDHYFTS